MRVWIFALGICLMGASCERGPNLEPISKALTCACPRVAVEGVMQNRSENYFGNPRFVLKDESAEVDVQSWLPMEIAPYHPDAAEEIQRRGEKWPPETMANYLNVPLRIIGRIETRSVGGPILVVEHAERRK